MTSSYEASEPIFPAPWRISQISQTSIEAANGNGVASAGGFFNNTFDAEQLHREKNANARLIAAAPRMFDRIATLAAAGDAEAIAIVEAVNGRA